MLSLIQISHLSAYITKFQLYIIGMVALELVKNIINIINYQLIKSLSI